MIEYGYINESGYLVAREFEESQIKSLDASWKPVDPIDPDKIQSDEDGFIIKVMPYDNGDKISYHYQKAPDYQKIRNLIVAKKKELEDSDYQVIKCYEASLVGIELPYDIEELHVNRQLLREEINSLEASLPNA